MHPALGVLAGRALERAVRAAPAAELLELGDDRVLARDAKGELLEVDELELVHVRGGPVVVDEGEARLGVDKDDLGGALVDGEDAGHLADGAGAEDGDLVLGVDGRVLDAVVRSGEDVGEIQR